MIKSKNEQSKKLRKQRLQIIYNVVISTLALSSVALVVADLNGWILLTNAPYKWIDTAILLFFTVDYVVRLIRSDDRRSFFLSNITDLLAIVPFSTLFSLFRFFRIFRILRVSKLLRFTKLLRGGAFLSVFNRRVKGILQTNGFIYILYANLVMILLASVTMVYAEKMTFLDALWWSFVTCTTVGYGDISPSSTLGRIVAVVLMLFGIGLVGMLTGSITTYFANSGQKSMVKSETNDELEKLISAASDEEREKILEITKIILKK